MDAISIIILSILLFLFLFFAIFYSLVKRGRKEKDEYIQVKNDTVLWLIWMAPPIWQWVVVGDNLFRIIGLFLLGMLLLIWFLFVMKKEIFLTVSEAKKALILYTIGMISFSMGMIPNLLMETQEEYPTIQILSFFVLTMVALEAIAFVVRICKKKSNLDIKQYKSMKKEQLKTEQLKTEQLKTEQLKTEAVVESTEEKPIKKRDIMALLAIMLLWGLMAFVYLGSTDMPHTSIMVAPEETDTSGILLDLGEQKEIQLIQVHLGRLPQRTMTVYCISKEDGEWFPANKEAKLTYSYRWNPLWVLQNTQYIHILPQEEEAEIQEIVIFDKQGERVLPINADSYPKLFDEQEYYDMNQTSYSHAMFDEIYYAGSALDFLQGREMFEMTHPPMGKILIALGIGLFGINPFGWRIVCVMFGLALLPLFYRFLYIMFRNTRIALTGTILLSLDFMHFTLSRIGTIDAIIAFFVLAMFTVMWEVLTLSKKELKDNREKPSMKMRVLLCTEAILTGMAISTKWTGFYAAAGLTVIFVAALCILMKQRKRSQEAKQYVLKLIVMGLLLFTLVPFGIYTLSFVPQTLASGEGNPFSVMWESSLSMLNFHSTVEFHHAYSSPWYTWGWMKKPLLDDGTDLGNGWVSLIVTMGNPLLWWCGFISFVHMLFRTFYRKDKRAGYLSAAYLIMYVPWIFVERTVFIYQYYCSSIFMIGMLGYSLCLIWKQYPKRIVAFCIAALLCFLLFWPILSGWRVSTQYVSIALEWLKTWDFVI